MDLLRAALLSLACTALAGWFGWRWASRRHPLLASLTAILTVLVLILYGRHGYDDLRWATVLPWAGLPVAANLYLPLAGFLAGLAWATIPGSARRKARSVGPLVVITSYLSLGYLFMPAPHCSEIWMDTVCLQSSKVTCSAAAAATLLRAHGIAATEGEMASLCLTRRSGTSQLGLYRGLALKTRGTAWRVEVFQGDLDKLRGLFGTGPGAAIMPELADGEPASGPVILFVGLPRNAPLDHRYVDEWGWIPGVHHAVVCDGFAGDGRVIMGDPSVGPECWLEQGVQDLWQGRGLRLVPR